MSRRIFLFLPAFLSGAALPACAAQAADAPAVGVADIDVKAKVNYSAPQLIGLMDQAERDYYYKMFSYTMETVRPRQESAWKSYRSSGVITPETPFGGKNTVCRPFKEKINIQGTMVATFEGVGCKRVGEEGWCKLTKSEMLSCAGEPPNTTSARIAKRAQRAGEKVEGWGDKIWGWWPW